MIILRGQKAEEPAAKRVKLTNGELKESTFRVDARDKVKGVALVKEE